MTDKSAQDLFNEMDILWDNFKSATWNTVSVVPATIKPINPTKEWKIKLTQH
jgi:hypothetical protein